jgi:hypothetical protein
LFTAKLAFCAPTSAGIGAGAQVERVDEEVRAEAYSGNARVATTPRIGHAPMKRPLTRTQRTIIH